ncbi:MAG: hypothetical protein ABIQ15_10010 [Nocardioides sp.]
MALLAAGLTLSETSRPTGVARSTLRDWECGPAWPGIVADATSLITRTRSSGCSATSARNRSQDILRLCTETLDPVGVAWRRPRATCIAVSRRDDARRLDAMIGAEGVSGP